MLQGRRGGSGHDVGNDHIAVRNGAWDDGIAIRPPRQECSSGERGAGAVHAPRLRERTRLAEHAAGHHDDAGIAPRQPIVVQAELRHRAGREILDHDVGPFDEWIQHLAAGAHFQVQRQAALRRVQVSEPGLVVEAIGP
jgi:hypothetical protein